MNARVKRPVSNVSGFRYREALGLEHDVQRRQAVVHVLDAAFGRIAEFVDQRTHGLRAARRAHHKCTKRAGQEPARHPERLTFHLPYLRIKLPELVWSRSPYNCPPVDSAEAQG